MEKQKESFLIIFEDKIKVNMVMHIKKEKVDNFFLLYLEPGIRTKNDHNRIISCGCDTCILMEKSLMESSEVEGVFNGVGFTGGEECVSFVCIRVITLNNIETLLEKITGEKIKHINLINKEKLSNSSSLSSHYVNSDFEDLLRNLSFSF